MGFEVVVSVEASMEAQEAVGYYQPVNEDLSDRFIEELEALFKKLAHQPEFYSFIDSNKIKRLRDVKMPSFPFVVVYEISQNTVIVASIHNTYKDRKY